MKKKESERMHCLYAQVNKEMGGINFYCLKQAIPGYIYCEDHHKLLHKGENATKKISALQRERHKDV